MDQEDTGEIDKQIADLKEGLRILSLNYDDEQIGKFRRYAELLYELKGKLNLISRADYAHMAARHMVESLLAIPYLPAGNISACDIGAGAGFPGVPIKIMRPAISLVLVESKVKKANFLKRLISELRIDDANVFAGRFEELKGHRFDMLFCRAVGRIADVIRHTGSLIKPGGRILFYKSHDVANEIGEASRVVNSLGLKILKVDKLHSPLEDRPVGIIVLGR